MIKPHPVPSKHNHRCFDCTKCYECQKPECRKLLWFMHCPRCFTRADWFFRVALEPIRFRLVNTVEEVIQKAKKEMFNPRPKQPTLVMKK